MTRQQFNKMTKALGICALSASLAFTAIPISCLAAPSSQTDISLKESLSAVGVGVTWAKQRVSAAFNEYMMNELFLDSAGNGTEWYALSLARLGYLDDYESYLGALYNYITNKYKLPEKLHAKNMTEWHKLAIAIASCGGNPTDVSFKEGETINLIKDGVTNADFNKLTAQGMNAVSWALISLDSLKFDVPSDATITREKLITYMLSNQSDDGGFSLSGKSGADVDITAMVLQALAPYYNDTNSYDGKTVREVADKALDFLSKKQGDNGDFASYNFSNSESTSQVIVALCSLGINPDSDSRFIKNGNTCIDGLMRYQNQDGGFLHSKEYDSANPSASPDKSNGMATEQALYALCAYNRFENNLRSLYDCRDEMDDSTKASIKSLRDSIDALSSNDSAKANELFEAYKQIPVSERQYVYNFYKLWDTMKALNLDCSAQSLSENFGLNIISKKSMFDLNSGKEVSYVSTSFTKDHQDLASQINAESTADLYNITKLLFVIKNASNKSEFSSVESELFKKLEAVQAIQDKINKLNDDIQSKVYPVSALKASDRSMLEDLVKRYKSLDPHDQGKIIGMDDVNYALENLGGSSFPVVPVACGAGVVVIAAGIGAFVLKRKKASSIDSDESDLFD